MALVRAVKAQFGDGAAACGLAFEYDDQTLALANVVWVNQTAQPMAATLTRDSNGQSVGDTVNPQTPLRRRSVVALGITGVVRQGAHGGSYIDFGVSVQTQYPAG